MNKSKLPIFIATTAIILAILFIVFKNINKSEGESWSDSLPKLIQTRIEQDKFSSYNNQKTLDLKAHEYYEIMENNYLKPDYDLLKETKCDGTKEDKQDCQAAKDAIFYFYENIEYIKNYYKDLDINFGDIDSSVFTEDEVFKNLLAKLKKYYKVVDRGVE